MSNTVKKYFKVLEAMSSSARELEYKSGVEK
jgi:hypothetical protein